MNQLPSKMTDITFKRLVAITEKAVCWSVAQVRLLLDLPFNNLIYQVQLIHRQHHDANAVQLSTLISVKTGGCPEDCSYCPQAARHHAGVENQDMLSLEEVVLAVTAAKSQGASRFYMGAAWRGLGLLQS